MNNSNISMDNINIKNGKKHTATGLNDYDRKIIEKYTKTFTNFIESSTARTEITDDKRYDAKK